MGSASPSIFWGNMACIYLSIPWGPLSSNISEIPNCNNIGAWMWVGLLFAFFDLVFQGYILRQASAPKSYKPGSLEEIKSQVEGPEDARSGAGAVLLQILFLWRVPFVSISNVIISKTEFVVHELVMPFSLIILTIGLAIYLFGSSRNSSNYLRIKKLKEELAF